jgi:release factor glutamine methyltransferase
MKAAIKHIVAHTYKPLLEKYLSRTRIYKYEDIHLEIAPQVFHPGFFFSTDILLNYLKKFPLAGKNFFEPGCGSGLISVYAAKKGANVTASDINPVAIEFLKKNSRSNNVEINIIQSDLFQQIPIQQFDIIAINPPYYKKQPVTHLDYAWLCGENGEYFSSLFLGLADYMHNASVVLMILFDGCDMEMIKEFAEKNNLKMELVHTQKNFLEKNFIYRIEKKK